METVNMDWIDELLSEEDDELDWYEDLAAEYDAEAVDQGDDGVARSLRVAPLCLQQQLNVVLIVIASAAVI